MVQRGYNISKEDYCKTFAELGNFTSVIIIHVLSSQHARRRKNG